MNLRAKRQDQPSEDGDNSLEDRYGWGGDRQWGPTNRPTRPRPTRPNRPGPVTTPPSG